MKLNSVRLNSVQGIMLGVFGGALVWAGAVGSLFAIL